MHSFELNIPTLYSNQQDFRQLTALCRQVLKTDAPRVNVLFHECTFLKASAVACLSAALEYARDQGRAVEFDFSSMPESVYRACCNYQFFSYFGGPLGKGSSNTIALRKFSLADQDLFGYLSTQVTHHQFFPTLSATLRRALCARLIEIYANAFTHSRSPVATFSCGQGYPFGVFHFQLTVVDLGVGIPANVRTFLKQPRLSGRQALQWALEEGHSTKLTVANNRSAGLGLKLLCDLAQLNQGKLEIYSHDSYACIQRAGIKVNNFVEDFPGTVLNLELRNDDSFYHLTSENSSSPNNALF